MKFSIAMLVTVLMAGAASAVTLSSPSASLLSVGTTGDKTITKVVKLLQNMLDESKKEGDEERVLYAKYKCYCDDKEAEKKADIVKFTEEIAMLESDIEKLLADNSLLSKQLAKVKQDIADVVQDLATALSIRNQEKSAYDAYKSDMNIAIQACNDSIIELATIGADQTLASGADHKQFMSDFSLRQLKATVKQALIAASATVTTHQHDQLAAFLQAPFTGTYTSQSGEVFGIIKDMRDTFMTNLAEATSTEKKAVTAYNAYKTAKEAAKLAMEGQQGIWEGDISDNDGDLSTKRGSLSTAQQNKGDAETFLDQLVPMCETKAKEYQHRVMLRTNEQAAVAKAISILNSDEAFASFGKVDATSTGATGFMQLRSVKHSKHSRIVSPAVREHAKNYLRGAAAKTHSPLISKIVAMLEVDNPFDTVLEKIQEMLTIIEEEGTADDEHLSWCIDERTNNDAKKVAKNTEIQTLNGQITTLETAIDHPITGLKVTIANTEESLRINQEDQKTETADRKEAEGLYKNNVANCKEAESLLKTAITVLEAYYKDLAAKQFALLQSKRKQTPTVPAPPAPPSTWSDDAGQGSDGNDAVGMLKYILGETKTEENAYHAAEVTDQHDYEDSMKTLTGTEETLRDDLADFQESLAKKQKELLAKEKDRKETIAERNAILKYLKEIKPGCDFITANIDLRKSNRDEETTALNEASRLIKESPAYTTAVAELHNETLADCLEFCAGDFLDTAKCKACRAGVTIPAYCAGHPTTQGC